MQDKISCAGRIAAIARGCKPRVLWTTGVRVPPGAHTLPYSNICDFISLNSFSILVAPKDALEMVMKYFEDDHGRTLRVVITSNGEVALALIDQNSGNTLYFKKHSSPRRESGIESSHLCLPESLMCCPQYVKR